MQKPISTKVHGILDYMTAGFLFALPGRWAGTRP